MDWLASVFDVSSGNAVRAAMLSGLVLSLLFTLVLRKRTWAEAAMWATGVVLVLFSAVLIARTGIHPRSPIGFGIMLMYVSIVVFPAAAIVRLAMRVLRIAANPAE
jgi:hypothetical protein